MPRPHIQDEFSDMPISRQRKYQLRRIKARLCVQCGNRSYHGTRFCRRCLRKKIQWRKPHKPVDAAGKPVV